MKHYDRELVFIDFFFFLMFLCVLIYDKFSVRFKSSALDLLKPLSSFSSFVFKVTIMLFLFYSVTNNKHSHYRITKTLTEQVVTNSLLQNNFTPR